MMLDFAMPAAYAVLVWWFATGIILFLDGLPRRTFRWSMSAGTAVLAIVAVELHASAGHASAAGAYAAFTCAILVWGWLEMSFLMGFITGPRKHACQDHCHRGHFWHAAQAFLTMPAPPSASTSSIFARFGMTTRPPSLTKKRRRSASAS